MSLTLLNPDPPGKSLSAAQFPGAGENGVFQFVRRIGAGLGVAPAIAVAGLAEHHDFEAVGPQRAVGDIDRDFQPLIRSAGGDIPVGNDDPAERIGRYQRHEGHCVERGVPEIGIDPQSEAAGGAGDRAIVHIDGGRIGRRAATRQQQGTKKGGQNSHRHGFP